MSAPSDAVRRSYDWRRPLRYLWRLPFLAWHVFIDLPITLALINPLSARIVLRDERLDHLAIRWWSTWMMRVFGMRVRRFGTPLPGGVLFVANHVSWID